ncbi:MAG: MMPL family transporter [Myxococcota bacterium]
MRLLTVIWTLLAAGLVTHQVFLWKSGVPVETDLLSLLPKDERDPAAEEVLQHLSQEGAKSLTLLLTAKTKAEVTAGAQAFVAALKSERLERVTTAQAAQSLPEQLAPWKESFLTAAQLERLPAESTEQLAGRALLQLNQPLGARLGDFREDPLQLFAEYLRERAQVTKVRPEGELLVFETDAGHHVLLRYTVKGGGFSMDGTPHLADAIAAAKQALPAGVELHAAGVPLFAEAAAVQANRETSTVGLGSLAAILVIMFLAFRGPRPLLLVVLSVGMGVVAGLSVCVLLFGRVHLMTLVFGASLVGVAEDYGIHYFASRQSEPTRDRNELLRSHTPGLLLAMLTSVAGYVVLALAPFPGLRQVAIFSSVGLAAAFLTVLAWFPHLDRGEVTPTRFSQVWASTRRWWPTLSPKALALGLLAVALVSAIGFWKLKPQDDIRALQASPKALVDAQRTVAERVGLPSPAQFFIVRGATEAERLAREEALTAQLDALIPGGLITGYDGVSRWVPSPDRQARSRELFRKTRAAVLTALADELEDPTPLEGEGRPFTVADALQTQLGEALRPLWLPDVSVVLLHAPTKESLPTLATLGALPGVRFVDRTGDISSLMHRWRVGMSELLFVGLAVIYAVLWWRFRRDAWRALLPTVVASALALALVGYLGEPMTLFHVLALFLLLGMGVDYGIFLVEHPDDAGEAWLAIGLGAVSTLLSFGLLAVSTTPAIHAFGVTLGAGVTLVWLLSPLTAPTKR